MLEMKSAMVQKSSEDTARACDPRTGRRWGLKGPLEEMRLEEKPGKIGWKRSGKGVCIFF